MIPGATNGKFFKVTTVAGVAVTGLTTVSFTFTALALAYGGTPATYVPSPVPTVVEIGSGYYYVSWGLYSSAGFDALDIVMAAGSNIVSPAMFGGEVEAYGAAQLAALCARPTATISATSLIGAQLPLTLVPYRYRGGSFAIVLTIQLGGTPVDLTAFNNFRMSIRSADQVSYKWEGGVGIALPQWAIWHNYASTVQGNFSITGSNLGILTVTIPSSLVGPVYLTWTPSVVYNLGDMVVPITSNGYVYCCTTAGTSHSGGGPSWPTTPGTTVTETGGVVWTCLAQSVWQATTAYAKDQVVTPNAGGTPATGGVYAKCVTPGTSSGSEPTWGTTPSAKGATITDGTATWRLFNDPYGVLPAGVTSIQAYYEITGQLLSTGETVDIIPSSALTIARWEQGT